jgi:hypothetical protein
MAPAKKSAAKANAEPSKHNIMSFFGSAQSQGAATGSKTGNRSQSEVKPKATLTKVTKVESDDEQGGKATPKFKCATFSRVLHVEAGLMRLS